MKKRIGIIESIKAWYAKELCVMRFPMIQTVGSAIHFNEYIEKINNVMIEGGRADAQDPNMMLVDETFFSQDNFDLFKSWLANNGLNAKYDTKYFDCDDFAISYWSWCRILYERQKLEGVPFIGYCKSATINHCFNFAITQNGLRFIEPQTGKIIENPGGIYWMQF